MLFNYLDLPYREHRKTSEFSREEPVHGWNAEVVWCQRIWSGGGAPPESCHSAKSETYGGYILFNSKTT